MKSSMSWRDDLRYKLLGPFWPEYLVAKELRKKGWTIYRHFNCFDPDNGQYAEIDVLAVSADGFLVIEIKSYAGEWESRDHMPMPMWQRIGWSTPDKSPVWQVKRARLALINSIRRAYPAMKRRVLDSCRTYVLLDRGKVINATEPSIQKAWADMAVTVWPLTSRAALPDATAPASPAFLEWLGLYRARYRWRWYFRLLHRVGYLPRYLERIRSNAPEPRSTLRGPVRR